METITSYHFFIAWQEIPKEILSVSTFDYFFILISSQTDKHTNKHMKICIGLTLQEKIHPFNEIQKFRGPISLLDAVAPPKKYEKL